MKRGILFLLLTTFWGVFVEAGNNKEVPVSNLRVPAYPLVTIDPYISAWSHTDKLYEDEVRHWTGTEHSLTGVLRVDGKCYRFMGKGEQALTSILKDARDEEWTAKYTNTMPYADWYTKEYNDTEWQEGAGHSGAPICLMLKPSGIRGIFGYVGSFRSKIRISRRNGYISFIRTMMFLNCI